MGGRRLFGSCLEQPLSQQCYFHRHSRQRLAKERIVCFYCCGTEQWSCQLYQCLGCTLRHFWQARPHSQSFVCVCSLLSLRSVVLLCLSQIGQPSEMMQCALLAPLRAHRLGQSLLVLEMGIVFCKAGQ